MSPNLPLKALPRSSASTLQVLDINESVDLLANEGTWLKVITRTGQQGYLRQQDLGEVWVKAHKKERQLFLMKGARIEKTYTMALCAKNPLADKMQQGDCATPEGKFYICELDGRPQEAKYGARSLRLSYPNAEHARRGLKQGLISFRQYTNMVSALNKGRVPDQKTKLGGSIRIHGGGSASDWTAGCLALEDKDVAELFQHVAKGTRVEIYRSREQDLLLNQPGNLNRQILGGAKKQLKQPALYTKEAASSSNITFPLGDIDPRQAVCTDVIVRALRQGGLDLQALVYEDILSHPERYRRWVNKPNLRLDHRRTRVLQIYFSAHAQVLLRDPAAASQRTYQSGDIVVLDTGIANGTPYDHIGIVDDHLDENGIPLVINIWTFGYRTASMALLGKSYPTVVGHFRLNHSFDYQ